MRFILVIIFIVINFNVYGYAIVNKCFSNWYCNVSKRLSTIIRDGKPSLMISGFSWHNRWTYSAEDIKGYNEKAYGGGLALYRSINQYEEDFIGALGFMDSFGLPEVHVVYSWMKTTSQKKPLGCGLGLGGGVYFKYHCYASPALSYLPAPFILPLVSLRVLNINLFATYIPGFNVAYIFSRLDF
jgi:palmitoyl transferase